MIYDVEKVIRIAGVNCDKGEGRFFMNINNVIYEKLYKIRGYENNDEYDYHERRIWGDDYYFPTESEVQDYMSEYPRREIDGIIPKSQGKIYTLKGLKMRGFYSSEIFHFGGYVMRAEFCCPPVMK